MPKRADPVATEKWAGILSPIAADLDRRNTAIAELQRQLGDAIRGAFADGVQVGAIKAATGLSGSRIYQYKFALRDHKDAGKDAG